MTDSSWHTGYDDISLASDSQGDNKDEEDDEEDDVESSAVSNSSQSTEDAIHLSPRLRQLQMIQKAIDRLNRLSVAIRRPSIFTQSQRAASYIVKDEDGNDTMEAFEAYALAIIKLRFKDCSPEIQHRLSQAIALRRRKFLYRQRHQEKLRKRSYSGSKDRTRIIHSASRTALSGMLSVNHSITRTEIERSSPAQRDVASVQMSGTEASKFTESKFLPDAKSSIASTAISTASLNDAFNIPPAPKIPKGLTEFQCPYCCVLVPAKESHGKRWRSVTPFRKAWYARLANLTLNKGNTFSKILNRTSVCQRNARSHIDCFAIEPLGSLICECIPFNGTAMRVDTTLSLSLLNRNLKTTCDQAIGCHLQKPSCQL